ncbi:MAG: hypothetical protein Q9166_004153 [cf. Caloplaca sp. 2 TL-2023]
MYHNLLVNNARICHHGSLTYKDEIYVDGFTGRFMGSPTEFQRVTDLETVDMNNKIIAPAFIELQTNGCLGVHFTQYTDGEAYQENLERASRWLVQSGVGAFYVTLPTVEAEVFQEMPSQSSVEQIYGDHDRISSIKMVTLAPELEGSTQLIEHLTKEHNIKVSLGHSAADFDTGLAALQAGATTMTHVFNAMNPLHHRSPGLAGLMASGVAPYFSVIADGIHLHPATLTMAFRADPQRCILITDSIEMAGLPDGLYAGHAQIPHQQRKDGNKVTIDGTDTLIGSCSSIDECVRKLKQWSGCTLAEAVQCATENIANMMGLRDRGIIEVGRRADFVVLDDTGQVLETWIGGKRVYRRWKDGVYYEI